jgi:O-antigen/teichoic acid export membrane protein
MEKRAEITKQGWTARRAGYIATIVVFIVLLYIFLHLYDWGVPFITEEYNDLLLFIRLSFYASIIAHAIFLIYDPKWFRHLLKAGVNVFSSLSTIMFYVVFPFDFPTEQLNKIIKIVLLILIILSFISILTEIFKAIRNFGKEREETVDS